jgi:hypothetical protein
MGLERTFGARWPVPDRGPAPRDMKRGPIAAPDHHRDTKRERPPADPSVLQSGLTITVAEHQ